MAVGQGTGTTITLPGSYTVELISIDGPNLQLEDIETSHMGTSTYKTFEAADLKDAGELNCTVHFNPAVKPPIGTAGSVSITWADGSTWAWSDGNSYIKSFSAGAQINTMMEAQVTVKLSGDYTVS